MPDGDVHKYKGVGGPHRQAGLGRLRRASRKQEARPGGWERRQGDDAFLETHATSARPSHSGEHLLARFNRLAGALSRDASRQSQTVLSATISGFAGPEVLVDLDAGGSRLVTVRNALLKRVSGVKNPLCVGDRVQIAASIGSADQQPGRSTDGQAAEAAPGSGGVIVAMQPRRNQLARCDSHNRALIQVFAANLDCLVVVAAIVDPELKFGLIDRYLLIAAWNGIPAVVVLNKCDRGNPGPAAAVYRALGLPVFTVSAAPAAGGAGADAGSAGASGSPGLAASICAADLEALRAHLRGADCVIAGQSGVGKSSLANALFPGLDARVGRIAEAGHGRHTTSSTRRYPVEGGGHVVDTPGVRECGIAGMTAIDVALLFPDIAALHRACRFNDCSHTHEPDCAVRAEVGTPRLAPSRYASYVSIIQEDLIIRA